MLELDWDGNVLWEHIDHSQHHDLRRLPNGNTLYIGWREMREADAARVRGGIDGTEHEGKIYEDYFREVTPSGDTAWEWATSSLRIEDYPLASGVRRAEFAHGNTCSQTPGGDILINFRNTDMMAIVSRSEKKIIWERREFVWGRPHDPQILPNGNIMFFANGAHDMLAPQTSSVIEFDPKTGTEVWRYEADIPWHFYSHVMGGCQPLPNGNVLICQSAYGRIFEVTRSNQVIWDYVNPDFDSQFPRGRQKANCVFRAFRYAASSPELVGRVL
ncbi:MAG: hypothetical protein HZB40_17905 [Rhodocyclales bacterium]|nr:hypothetical protein [Rhodocyclales bacterium]